jgi:hypothetical protein
MSLIILEGSFASLHTCLAKRLDLGKFTDEAPSLLCYNKLSKANAGGLLK